MDIRWGTIVCLMGKGIRSQYREIEISCEAVLIHAAQINYIYKCLKIRN